MALPFTYDIPNVCVVYDILDAVEWCERHLRRDAYEFVYPDGEVDHDTFPLAVRYADPSLAGTFAHLMPD